MPTYEFSRLSSQDFEELTRDLLRAEWRIQLESFKSGRDAGIDLRYTSTGSGSTIVQCKHYIGSGYAKLVNHLRRSEQPKVALLRPQRYVLVTSVALSPSNKDEITCIFHPFIQNPGDVLGRDDIESLLRQHPKVEQANFKLWLTSATVLQRVLHNAEHCQTDFEVDRVCRKLPIFVQISAFPRALAILEDTRIIVISGVPGIGKTTLAEMLLYTHLEQGYEPVVIQAEISERRKLYKPNTKQIFYYDDFLGQIFLKDRREFFGRNQDVALVDFMELIRRSKHSRFVLTTREHILRNAMIGSEKLLFSPMLDHKCVLALQDYTLLQRAKNFYNHLYISDLPREYKEQILHDDFYLEVIKHNNFNPRIIEWLSARTRLRNVEPASYRAHISGLLEAPEQIWTHAFEEQISDASRSLLLTLYTLGTYGAELLDLEPAWTALHRYRALKYNWSTSPCDFRIALTEMEGAFLTCNSTRIDFINPSVRDFIASVIAGHHEHVSDLVAAAVRFRQLATLWQLAGSRPSGRLREYLTSDMALLTSVALRLLPVPHLR